jgi:mRNA-degrading endonuclease toxin of MazEF toxin-antitoxin module
MAKGRPGVIVSNDILNDTSTVVEVVYLSTKLWKKMPTHATIEATGLTSVAKCEQIDSVSKERLGKYCGTCTDEEMEAIDRALLCSLGIELDETTEEELLVEVDIEAELPDDPVNHPSHYTDGKIEVIDFIEDKKLNFHRGNAVKYIARAGKKDPTKTVQDLEKAKWYIEREIARLEAESDG